MGLCEHNISDASKWRDSNTGTSRGDSMATIGLALCSIVGFCFGLLFGWFIWGG
jgi:hypothetical protein